MRRSPADSTNRSLAAFGKLQHIPEDAYRCFMRTEMDALVLEDCVLVKTDQPPFEDDEEWRRTFQLD